MNNSALVRKVAQATGYEDDEVHIILDAMVTVVRDRLQAGEEVKLRGLGTFLWRFRRQTKRAHPKKPGEHLHVPEKFVLKFRPAKSIVGPEVPMEKYGVEVDNDKVKEAQSDPKKDTNAPNTNVPWDPILGTEPYEKKPEPKKKKD